MPWIIQKDNDQWCVHKQNADNTPGPKVKCHGSEQEAKAHMAALYANMEGEKSEMSFDDIRNSLALAIEPLRGVEGGVVTNPYYITEVYDRYIIVQDGGAYWKVGYVINDNGTAAIDGRDRWLPVEQEWLTKAALKTRAIKALGDWEIDILAIPFEGVDSDGQVFDANTDIMQDTFPNPAIIYHHGIVPGSDELQAKPAIIGKAKRVEKRADGWHVIGLLDKAVKWARDVWEAAKKGLAVASSDSISHLVRLEVGGKMQPYTKNTPGRIAVWPLAGVSVWNLAEGNLRPASRNAIALPAMKAIYQEAGIPFPVINAGTTENDEPEADKAARIAKKNLQKQARRIVSTWDES